MEDVRPGSSTNSQDQQEQATPDVRTYTCNYCGKVCSSKGAIIRHTKSDVCEKRWRNKLIVKKLLPESGVNIFNHPNFGNFECPECGKKYCYMSHLYKHMRTHTKERNFECLDSGKRFTQKGHHNHLFTHTGAEVKSPGQHPLQDSLLPPSALFLPSEVHPLGSLVSPVSPRVPAGPVDTSHHRCAARSSAAVEDVRPGSSTNSQDQQEQATPDMRTYSCDDCGKLFTTNAAVVRHIKTDACEERLRKKVRVKRLPPRRGLSQYLHGVGNFFECKECGKKFHDKSNFNRHTRIHTGEKNFECLLCGKRFVHRNSLKDHYRKHTGERRVECLMCGKRFAGKGDLNRHISIHTGEKRFECLECGKKFTQVGHLNVHTISHTGERNYECDVCGKKFYTKSNIRRHMNIHFPPDVAGTSGQGMSAHR